MQKEVPPPSFCIHLLPCPTARGLRQPVPPGAAKPRRGGASPDESPPGYGCMSCSAASPIRSGIPLLRGTSSEGGSAQAWHPVVQAPADRVRKRQRQNWRGPGAMRGVPRSGLWSEVQFRRAEPAAIGRKVASVAEQILPSDRGPGAQRGVPRSGL